MKQFGKFHRDKLTYQWLIRLGLTEIKAGQMTVDGKFGGMHRVIDRADRPIDGVRFISDDHRLSPACRFIAICFPHSAISGLEITGKSGAVA